MTECEHGSPAVTIDGVKVCPICRIAAQEQEREVLRGTLFRAEGVIEAYVPDSPVLDAIDRALNKGKNGGD